MPFHIVADSVNGGTAPFARKFDTPGQAKDHAVRELRGVSCYWQVWIENSDGQRVERGYRTGPGGTGETWAWSLVP